MADFKSEGCQSLTFGHNCADVKIQESHHKIKINRVVRCIAQFKEQKNIWYFGYVVRKIRKDI